MKISYDNIKFIPALTLLIVSMLFAPTTQAIGLKAVAGVGWDIIGGDLLVSGTSTKCGSTDQKANNGLAVNVGGVLIVDSYETQATIGYKHGSPAAENGTITWDAVPIELIQFYRPSNIRIGLGFIYQLHPRLVVDVPGLSYANYYENAFGTLAQIGWAPLNKSYSIDFRFTAINYKQSNASNAEEKNGNVIGIYSNYYF